VTNEIASLAQASSGLPDMPTLAKFAGLGGPFHFVPDRGPDYHLENVVVLTKSELDSATLEVNRGLAPAEPDRLAKLVTLLVGGYPNSAGMPDRWSYITLLRMHLAHHKFPGWAVEAAVWRAHERKKSVPTISEMVDLVKDEVEVLKWQSKRARLATEQYDQLLLERQRQLEEEERRAEDRRREEAEAHHRVILRQEQLLGRDEGELAFLEREIEHGRLKSADLARVQSDVGNFRASIVRRKQIIQRLITCEPVDEGERSARAA